MALFSPDASVLYSSLHGRQRREERHIAKATLVLARRYGMKESEPKSGNVKYTYAGVTFVYDPISETEITSYASADYASPISGTRNRLPIFPRRKYGGDREPLERLLHAQCRTNLFQTRQWTSHTVIVVDISGSMRIDDVDSARCRSDGVWLSVAKDFVETAIRNKTAKPTDVVSVICMGDTASIVLRCEPTDYILYNILLDFREFDMIRPEGPGNYRPALQAAERLLRQYDTKQQAVSLVFVSDGAPSDKGDFDSHMGTIAQEFGRRLSVTCVGIGNDDDFQILQDMVNEAQAFHSNATFYRARGALSTDSLSNIFTCLSSFTAVSKLELTTRIESRQLTVRSGVLRERLDAPDDLVLDDGWKLYKSSSMENGVIRVWSWDRVKDDFVCLLDPRCIVCFTVVANCETMEADPDKGSLCGECKACFACHACRDSAELYQRHSSAECKRWLKKRRRGEIIVKPLPSFSIAIKNAFFSEGVERMVAKTRFVDVVNQFVGKKMVAKQSRFVEEDNSYEARMDYHRQFLRTQSISSAMARKFNAALQSNADNFQGNPPRIRFLEPLVFELADENQQETNQLVEEMMEGRYEKFNNNMGFVRHDAQRGVYCSEDDDESFPFYIDNKQSAHSLSARVQHLFQGIRSLAPVEEENKSNQQQTKGGTKENTVDPYELVQAFSHFTFEASKQNLIVVDLQGTLAMDNKPPEVILTDPAINTRSETTTLSCLNLGRTDRGDRGISSFFQTHECGPTCKLLHLSSLE